jgi:hypothetical protein
MTVCDRLPVDSPKEQLRELFRFADFFDGGFERPDSVAQSLSDLRQFFATEKQEKQAEKQQQV